MGAPAWSGPEAATGGSVAGVVAVVLVPDVEPWCDDCEPVWVAGEPEPQALRNTANDAATMVQCRYRLDFPRTGPVWRAAMGATLRPMATTRDISYEADGRSMVGTLALPDGDDRRPGVLVCHEGPGLDDHARGRAARLADELGYVAFALDYHGGGQPITDRKQMMGRIGELRDDPLRARAIGTVGLDILRAESRTDTGRLAAIGYCFGGTLSIELARGGTDLKAVVGFHSGLATVRPDDARNITAKVLALIGADDPIVDNTQRREFEEEMRAGGVDWQLVVYGGAVHSFTNPAARNLDLPGIAYDEATDRRSWQAMCDLFAEVF